MTKIIQNHWYPIAVLPAMIDTSDIKIKILEMADKLGPEKSIELIDIARALDSNNWRNLIQPVKLVVDTLIREGKIISTQTGSFRLKKLSKVK